jgi:transcriptional regulator GlxA family with amidase domain
MATQVSMSVRTFTRRFRDETGDSPGRWLQRQRIELARTLLETTDLSMEQVAARCGLNTAQSLRLHFHAALGITPTAYRRTFRG